MSSLLGILDNEGPLMMNDDDDNEEEEEEEGEREEEWDDEANEGDDESEDEVVERVAIGVDKVVSFGITSMQAVTAW